MNRYGFGVEWSSSGVVIASVYPLPMSQMDEECDSKTFTGLFSSRWIMRKRIAKARKWGRKRAEELEIMDGEAKGDLNSKHMNLVDKVTQIQFALLLHEEKLREFEEENKEYIDKQYLVTQ